MAWACGRIAHLWEVNGRLVAKHACELLVDGSTSDRGCTYPGAALQRDHRRPGQNVGVLSAETAWRAVRTWFPGPQHTSTRGCISTGNTFWSAVAHASPANSMSCPPASDAAARYNKTCAETWSRLNAPCSLMSSLSICPPHRQKRRVARLEEL